MPQMFVGSRESLHRGNGVQVTRKIYRLLIEPIYRTRDQLIQWREQAFHTDERAREPTNAGGPDPAGLQAAAAAEAAAIRTRCWYGLEHRPP